MSAAIAARRVEEHVRRLWEYYTKWGIKVNSAKSEVACFRRPVRRLNTRSATACHSIIVNLPDGTQLTPKPIVKYLGINFEERLRFNPHVTALLKKANYAFHRIYPLMRKRNGLNKKTKLLLYKQLLRPIVTYGFPVWFTISKTSMKKLGVFERKLLRICTDLHFDQGRKKYISNQRLYEAAAITPLERYMTETARKLVTNLANHPNPLVRAIPSEERNPEPRYLDIMAIMDEEIISINDDEAIQFYEDAASIYHRG